MTSDTLASVAEIILAVGGIAITVFGWLSAQTAKASVGEVGKSTADGLNTQLELILEPMNKQIDGIVGISDDVRSLVQQVARLDVLVHDVRVDVAAVRRDLGI